ncbi:F-box domain-containing protein [Pseudozyma hubeiensis]|nr:F-box domain-containing protein [Pseudozyma hubeiensis]
MRAVDRLPNEILIEVASNLDMADLLSISQTHRSWRQILTSAPRLWTKLTVKSEVKRPSHHQLIKLFEHILMVAERSQHSLEYVVLRVHSPGHWAKQVHHILQLSAATLNHIELYAPNQPFMYTQLYRFCPLLRKLVFLDDDEVSIPVTPVTAQMLPVKDLPPITQHEAEPFHLEEFHANKDEDDDPQMDKHLDKIASAQNTPGSRAPTSLYSA